MAALIDLSGYGRDLSGFDPRSIRSAINSGADKATAAAERTYRQATDTVTANLKQRSTMIKKMASQGGGGLANRLLGAKASIRKKLQEEARMLGAEAATGAREDTMEKLKEYAPWIIGGAAVLVGGIVLMRRK